MAKVGEIIRVLRIKRGLTQVELAKSLHFSRVEYHKTRPARRGDDPAQFITLDVFPAVSSHV